MFSRRKVNSQPVTLALFTTPSSSSPNTQNCNSAFAAPAIVSVVDGYKTQKNKLMTMNATKYSLTSQTHVMAHTYSGALIAEAMLPHNSNAVKDAGVISVPYKGNVLICRVQKLQKHKTQSGKMHNEINTDNTEETEKMSNNDEDVCTDLNVKQLGTMSTRKEVMCVYGGRELLCSLPLAYKDDNDDNTYESSKDDANSKIAFIDKDERERAARYPFLCKTNHTEHNILNVVFLVQPNAIGIVRLDLKSISPQSHCNYQYNSQTRNLPKANVDVITFRPYEGTDSIIRSNNSNNNNNDDVIYKEKIAFTDQLFISCYCSLDGYKEGALICVVLSDNTIALCGKIDNTKAEAKCELNHYNEENEEGSNKEEESGTTQDDVSESKKQKNYRKVDTHRHNTITTEQEEEEHECKEHEQHNTIPRSNKQTWQILARAKLPFSTAADKMNLSLQSSRVRRVCQVSSNTLCLVQENGNAHLIRLNLVAISKNDYTVNVRKNNAEIQSLTQENEELFTEEQEEVQDQLHLEKNHANNNTTSQTLELEIITLISSIQLPKWSSPEYCFIFVESGNSCTLRICYSADTTNQTLLEQQQQRQQQEEGSKEHEHKGDNNHTENAQQGNDCIRKTIYATIVFARSLLTSNNNKKLSIDNSDSIVQNVEELEEEQQEYEDEQEKRESTININKYDKNEKEAQIAISNEPNYCLTYSMFAVVENVYGVHVVSGLCELLTQATRAASPLYITTLPSNKTLMDDVHEHKTEELQSDMVQDSVGINKNNNVSNGSIKGSSVAYYFQQGKLDELHNLVMEKKLHECDLYECCQGCHDELNKIAVMLKSTRMNGASNISVLLQKLLDVEHLVYALTCREIDSPSASELLLMTENNLSMCTSTLANKLKSLGHSQAQRLFKRIHQLRYAMQTFIFLQKCYSCYCGCNYQSEQNKNNEHEKADIGGKVNNLMEDVWSAPLATVLSLESAHKHAQTRQDAMYDIMKSDPTFTEAAYLTHSHSNINQRSVSTAAANVMAQLTLWPTSSALCIDVILTSLQSNTLNIEEKSLCELLLSEVMSSHTAMLLLVLYCSNLPLFHQCFNSVDAQNADESNVSNNNIEEELLEEEQEKIARYTNYKSQEVDVDKIKVMELFKLQQLYLRYTHFVKSEQILPLAFVLCAIDHGVNPFVSPLCYNAKHGVNVYCNSIKTNMYYNFVMQYYMPERVTNMSVAEIISTLQIEPEELSSSSSLMSVWFNNLLCVGAYSNAAQEIASVFAFYQEPNTLPLYLAIRMLFVCTQMHNVEFVTMLYTKLQHTVLEETAIRALTNVAIHHKSMQTLINLFSSHLRHRTALQIIEVEVQKNADVELRQRLLMEWYIALQRYDDARVVCSNIHPHDESGAEQLHVIDAQLQSLQTNMC